MRSLFVANPLDLDAPVPGGVQRCSREFLNIVEAASEKTVRFSIDYDRSIGARLKRRSRLIPFAQYDATDYAEALSVSIRDNAIDTVFLNRTDLSSFVPVLAACAPAARVVLLSHGNESGDLLYEIAIHRSATQRILPARFYDFLWLGGTLAAEANLRHTEALTIVAMSEEEATIERWLGARDVLVLPRIITVRQLPSAPEAGLIGYIGSLHHTPNIVALEAVLSRLEACTIPIAIEIVGRPETVGARLAVRYPFVRYLGALDDAALDDAVARWSLFLNPIFWLSKGASMKLADALGRGLPVLTTRFGQRGYELPEGTTLVTDDNPDAFVAALVACASDRDQTDRIRRRILDTAACFASAATLAERLRRHIEGQTSVAPAAEAR